MNQRICFATLLCLFILVAVPVMAESERDILQRIADRNKMLRMKEIFKRQDAEILFYGRLVDQSNASVEGAVVDIQITQFNPDMDKLFGQVKTVHVQTDATGMFSVEKEKGRSIYVKGVSKAGYEYLMEQNPTTSFQFAEHGVQKPFVADKNAPVVFKLRKKGPTTFLIVSPSGNRPPGQLFRTKGTNGLTQPLDLLTWISGPGWKHCATSNADLRIDATFDAEQKSWAVTYAVTNGAEGVILSSSMLYEAPETGYVSRTRVIVTNLEQGCYLYLKSRTPTVYSRLFFNHRYDNPGDQSLRLYCKAWMNPYGERSLEYDDSLEASWRVVDELTVEAKGAIHAKQLPPKPDIPQRIKASNERVTREKAESDRRHKEWLEQQEKQKTGKAE